MHYKSGEACENAKDKSWLFKDTFSLTCNGQYVKTENIYERR